MCNVWRWVVNIHALIFCCFKMFENKTLLQDAHQKACPKNWAFVFNKNCCTLIGNHPHLPTTIHPRFAPKNWFNPSPFPISEWRKCRTGPSCRQHPLPPRPGTPVENQLRELARHGFSRQKMLYRTALPARPPPRPGTPVENQLRRWRGTVFRGHRAQSRLSWELARHGFSGPVSVSLSASFLGSICSAVEERGV